MNIGLAGKFRQLNDFLDFLGLKRDIVKKEAGAIPISGIPKKIVEGNMALIGDAASMTNPLSGGGISPIIYVSAILSKNIYDLEKYEKDIKNHPMFCAVVSKAKDVLVNAKNSELSNRNSAD
ncbi:MAG: hypothetical protein U9O96_06760 [Candidatus Thermoplasmatota archaeon]|nr:hypothetical protein [Candidatus Thermoplasmatota archaeon]